MPSPAVQKPAPTSEGYLAVPGARLYYRTIGTSIPLVVLHGGPDFNHRYLLPELDELAGRIGLVYYDQRGRGRSSGAVAPEDVTIDAEIEDLDRVRQHLGLEALSLCGHSWGCILALEYATRHPDRTNHVVLMNTAPASHADLLRFRGKLQTDEPESLARMRAIAATAPYIEGDIATEAEYYRVHFRRAVTRPEHLDLVVPRLRRDFTPEDIVKARAIEERLYEQTWNRPDYDLTQRLNRYAGPMLVLHGDHDFVPAACARNIAAAASGASLVILEESGHFSYLDTPERIQDAIGSFLSQA